LVKIPRIQKINIYQMGDKESRGGNFLYRLFDEGGKFILKEFE
jgi:hypothetical protein